MTAAREPIPSWFASALESRSTPGQATVDGVRISFRSWGGTGSVVAVLVHGGGAHASWWDHIAPLLTDNGRVIAMDLSGHGASGRRNSYSIESWATELEAVVDAVAGGSSVALIGHSMGGLVCLRLLARGHGAGRGAVAIDSVLRDVLPDEADDRSVQVAGSARRYPTREAALARFRPVPAQSVVLPFVRDHIASHSVMSTSEGWTWSFDPKVFRWTLDLSDLHGPSSGAPVLLIRAEHGLMTKTAADRFVADRRGATRVLTLPESGHHAMLDRPLALAAALRRALSG